LGTERLPYRGHRNASVKDYLHSLRPLWPCRIRRTEKAQDLILRDGDGAGTGYSFWAYDENLKLRWRADAHGAWPGMYMWFCHVDGDGRDVLPGYELYDGDGNKLWTMEGAEYIEDSGGAGHIDHAAFGELDGDPSNGPEIGIAGSDPGFFLVDARDGAPLRHHFFMDRVDLLQLRAVVFEGHHPQLRSALVDVGFVLDGA
jgi:hypothetical protein